MALKLHPSSLTYIVICVIGVFAFYLVGIYPNVKAMDELEQSIARLNEQLQTQELLYPVYRELIKEVQRKIPDLPVSQDSKISRQQINELNDIFLKMARNRQVTFESASPDETSYLEDSGHLTINVAFSGDFFNFQKLLLDISAMPYLASVDQMAIQTVGQGKRLTMKLQLDQE